MCSSIFQSLKSQAVSSFGYEQTHLLLVDILLFLREILREMGLSDVQERVNRLEI